MTKKYVNYEIRSLDVDYQSVCDVIIELQKIFKQYPDAELRHVQAEYGNHDYISVVSKRLETDREYQIRIDSENRNKAIYEERDRREFERLQKKFGKK